MNIITTITTILTALITAVYAYLTYKILKNMEANSIEENRPYVVVTLETKNQMLYLSIENIGKRPALNVLAKFVPELDERLIDSRLHGNQRILKQTVLLPRQSFRTVIAFNTDIFHHPKRSEILRLHKVTIYYNASDNRAYSEDYHVDLADFFIDKKSAEFTIDYSLDKISDNIKNIHELLKKKLD